MQVHETKRIKSLRKVCWLWQDAEKRAKASRNKRLAAVWPEHFKPAGRGNIYCGLLLQPITKRGAAWRGKWMKILFTVTVKLGDLHTFHQRQCSHAKQGSRGNNHGSSPDTGNVPAKRWSCYTHTHTHTSVSVKRHLERKRGHTRTSWSLRKASFK